MQHEQLLDVIKIQSEIAQSGLDLGSVMSIVVNRTSSLIGADGAAIELAEGNEMVYRATSGLANQYLGLRLKREESLSGMCVRQNTTLLCEDANNDWRVNRQACEKIGLRSMIVMPLSHKGEAVGVLKAMSTQVSRFSGEDIKLLELLSELVAAAMFYSAKYDTNELFYQATHDGLTGLANRSLFMDRLRNEISQASRSEKSVGVLIMDMNGLKEVNDTYGHSVGDAIIKEFSSRIKACARENDTVARLGGDEFGSILSPVSCTQGIEKTIARMHEEISRPFTYEDRTYELSACIGATHCPTDGCDISTLLELADQRMYDQKRNHYQLKRSYRNQSNYSFEA
ncbi:PAS domain S-box protein [Novimethylophilus kurashikiensis]|uniref:PAS domain S-box protein n=1 Tax=Novimethylophilus kurashikiensis TaxID=1825523 RepID=A0A2R5F365_9PROT|nr:sensor domain-containing diguanylate cyclase [Novimethylophilus kurashikiensis]GBG12589.1 PAS domain S-box protein [Novimethylophilus kurashikiensis]